MLKLFALGCVVLGGYSLAILYTIFLFSFIQTFWGGQALAFYRKHACVCVCGRNMLMLFPPTPDCFRSKIYFKLETYAALLQHVCGLHPEVPDTNKISRLLQYQHIYS